MPPAPGWLSTMTGWPSALPSAFCAARAIASTPEPVAFGRMKRIGLCRLRQRRQREAAGDAGDDGAPRQGEFVLQGRLLVRCVLEDAPALRPRRRPRARQPISSSRYPSPASSSCACAREARRLQANRQALATHGDRQQRRLHGIARLLAVGQLDVGEAAGGDQVRVVVQVLGLPDRRERQAGALEDRATARRRCGARAARRSVASSAGRTRTRSLLVFSAGSAFRSGEAERRRRKSATAHRSPPRGRSARRP